MAVAERYQLLGELGRGGMGLVYKAYDRRTDKIVALKVMTGFPEDDERDQKASERFKREIAIARSLKHDHVLEAIDNGSMRHNNRLSPYLVSPYMPDGSLENFIKKEPPLTHWTLLQVVNVIGQAAEGLHYMHTQAPPKIHLDVKPANFLIRLERRPERIAHLYLCDFGISRELVRPYKVSTDVMGTHQFLPPERLHKEEPTHAADQYSLAIMACLLLTGKFPFDASTPEGFAFAHVQSMPAKPSELNPERISSREVDEVILRALSKKPEERFPSIQAFARALYEAVVVRAAEAPTSPGFPPPLQNITSSTAREEEQSAPTEPSPPTDAPPLGLSLHPLPDGKDTWDVPPLSPPVPPVSPTPPPKPKVVPELLPIYPLQQSFIKELTARPRMIRWSPDGNYLVCTLYGQMPVLLGRNGRMEEIQTIGIPRVACWSPDSTILAMNLSNETLGDTISEIHFWDISIGSRFSQPLPLMGESVEELDWSRYGQLAIWLGRTIHLYAAPTPLFSTNAPAFLYTLPIQQVTCGHTGVLRWSPDGKLLAAGAADGSLICWNTSTPTPTLQWNEPPNNQRVYAVAWSPDSSLLAVAFSNKQVVVWNVYTRRIVSTWEQLPEIPVMLSISQHQRLTVALSTQGLFLGQLGSTAPAARHPGRLVATWSPTRLELAMLDARREKILTVCRE